MSIKATDFLQRPNLPVVSSINFLVLPTIHNPDVQYERQRHFPQINIGTTDC